MLYFFGKEENDLDAEIVGRIIYEHRKGLKMTQKELANKIGVTDKAVSKWERGGGLPDINILEPLAEVLKMSVTEIITGENKEKSVLNDTYEYEEVNKVLKSSLEYAQIKIKKAIGFCIPALIVSWIVLLLGVCVVCFMIQEIWIRCMAILLLIISTQLSGRVLMELIKQNK